MIMSRFPAILQRSLQRSILLTSLLLSAASVAAGINPETLSESEELISSYMNALQTGNTELIADLIEGKFKNRKGRILSNPTYPDKLMTHYRDATYTIDNIKEKPGGRIVVDITLTKTDAEVFLLSYVLERFDQDLKIIDELSR